MKGRYSTAKKRKDIGALKYVSPKFRKNVKALIRELGLDFVLAEIADNVK